MLLSREGTGDGEQMREFPWGGEGKWAQMPARGPGRCWEPRGLYSVWLTHCLFSVTWGPESLAESKDAGGVKSLRREKKKRII